jgi:hypothetical protein
MTSNRRSFLSTLASLTGIAALEGLAPRDAQAEPVLSKEWDLSWLDTMKGKHKQVFSAGNISRNQPLHVAVNYLDAHEEVYGLKFPQVNTIMGVSTTYPINATDAMWEKYELGRLWEVNDPNTKQPARRNVFLTPMSGLPGKVVSVQTLQSRGTVFWQCNNALTGAAMRIAREFNQPLDTVRADLLANLNPGVKLVPAHTMLLGLVQERGFTYEQIG